MGWFNHQLVLRVAKTLDSQLPKPWIHYRGLVDEAMIEEAAGIAAKLNRTVDGLVEVLNSFCTDEGKTVAVNFYNSQVQHDLKYTWCRSAGWKTMCAIVLGSPQQQAFDA